MGKLFAAILARHHPRLGRASSSPASGGCPPTSRCSASGIDHQLMETMIASGILFVPGPAGPGQLRLAVRRPGRRAADPGPSPAAPPRWWCSPRVLVGAEILVLSLVGTKVWAGIFLSPPDPQALQIDVQAEQFAYYFRYRRPGRQVRRDPSRADRRRERQLLRSRSGQRHHGPGRHRLRARSSSRSTSRSCSPCTPRTSGTPSTCPSCGSSRTSCPGLVIPLQFTATDRSSRRRSSAPSSAGWAITTCGRISR